MRHFPYIDVTIAYLSAVLMSFLLLTTMAGIFEEKYPSVMDKRWKKKLWLASCFLFIPVLFFLALFPSFIIGEFRKFLADGKDKERKEGSNGKK